MIKNGLMTQESRMALAQTLAQESLVLLKNKDNCLPLKEGKTAFFGRACYQPNLGGMGSGVSFMGKEIPSIYGACEKAGLIPEPHLHKYYLDIFEKEEPFNPYEEMVNAGEDLVASGIIYDIFGKYNEQPEEKEIPAELLKQGAEGTKRAVLVVGRSTGGEECDRRVEQDYYLLESEKKLIEAVCSSFSEVVVLLNVNGVMDFSWLDHYESIKAVLYIGMAGEMGPAAVADTLTGGAVPSGKLAFTVAPSYEDYSTAETFSFNKDVPESIREYRDYGLDAEANGSVGFEKSPVTLYREGLYMGYRYFDSFGKDVLYPFGFGMTFADFKMEELLVTLEQDKCHVTAAVKNVSENCPGKEVVQVYISPPDGKLEKPYQTYVGAGKTALLQPGARETVGISFSVRDMASYDEELAAWVLEPGKYYVRVGNSSRNTHIAGCFLVEEMLLCDQLENVLSLQEVNKGKIKFLSASGIEPITYKGELEEKKNAAVILLNALQAGEPCHGCLKENALHENILHENTKVPPVKKPNRENQGSCLPDVKKGLLGMDEFLSQLTDEELMALAVGYGPGLPFGGGKEMPCTAQRADGSDITVNTHKTGTRGYVSPAIPGYGIPSVFYKDGPARVGNIAWPTGMNIGCCFNTELLYAFGAACAYEAREQHVDSWLAPALNLHRSPIGGRNFEYFSEDPYVAGICGAAICQGACETAAVTCCPKHFALNEQETYRRGSSRKSIDAVDTIVTERTARELYLKPFEMVVKNTSVRTLMTSFNKINGVFAAGSYDLCTKILREEWGYKGVVVTDWGDMDIVVDGADAVAAGNDVIMPGGPPVIGEIKEGFEKGRVSRVQLETAVSHLLHFVMNAPSFDEC